MDVFFKVFGWVFGVLCIVSAVLQYNDPDPLLWMVIYGIAALVSFGFALGKISYSVLLVLGALCAVGFVYVFPEKFEGFEIGGGDIKNVEEGREAFGLLLLGLVMFTFAIRKKLGRRPKSKI